MYTEENKKIKKIIGSYLFSDEDENKTYQFYLAKTYSGELILIYASNKAEIDMSITQEEKKEECLPSITIPIELNKKLSIQITTQTNKITEPLFTIINLDNIGKKKEINKADIEKIFDCKVI